MIYHAKLLQWFCRFIYKSSCKKSFIKSIWVLEICCCCPILCLVTYITPKSLWIRFDILDYTCLMCFLCGLRDFCTFISSFTVFEIISPVQYVYITIQSFSFLINRREIFSINPHLFFILASLWLFLGMRVLVWDVWLWHFLIILTLLFCEGNIPGYSFWQFMCEKSSFLSCSCYVYP